MSSTEISDSTLESAVRRHLQRQELSDLKSLLATRRAPDVASVLERLRKTERGLAFAELEPRMAAAVLAEFGSDNKRDLVAQLARDRMTQLLAHMPMDDVTRLVVDVPERSEDVLEDLDPTVAAEVRKNLQYPKESAGRLMTERFVSVSRDMTAQGALEHLRQVHRDAETFTDLYVVDEDGHLEGVISLRDLVLAGADQQLREFMVTDVVSVAPADDQEVAARLLSHYNFLALPVTRDGRIVGIITVDDVIDVLIEESTEDQLRFGAVEPGVINQPYFTTPIWRVVRSRAGWLVLLFVAETLTGSVLRYFEGELGKVVALAFFVPLLIGTGGNTGAQTVSTIIRGLAIKEIRLQDTLRVLMRETWAGVLLGVSLGAIAFGRSELWGSGRELSLVVALSIACIVIWANTVGALIPLVAHRLRIDPALVSAPLITTLVDATGLVIYLTIARSLLTALH